MSAPTEPCPDCETDARRIATETVRKVVEPFGNQDVEENGETDIDDWITERVQVGECACRWKSPLGGCCLGSVNAPMSEIQEESAN